MKRILCFVALIVLVCFLATSLAEPVDNLGPPLKDAFRSISSVGTSNRYKIYEESVKKMDGITVETWKKGLDYDPDATFIRAYRDSETKKAFAVTFSRDRLKDDNSASSFLRDVGYFLEELGFSSWSSFQLANLSTAYLHVYSTDSFDAFPNIELSSDIQKLGDYGVRFYVTNYDYKHKGAVFVFGVDDRISSLPFLTDAPLATPAPTPFNPPEITYDEYTRIRTGMTYDEVCFVIGTKGVESASSSSGGSSIKIYSWDGSGSIGANARITFIDGKMTSKAQAGLE